MSVKLVSVAGPLQGTEIPLESDRVSIGRDPSNQIHIEDRLVSRRHCEIQRDGVSFHIKDLGSSNCTYVNDIAVGESPLQARDKITVGSSLFIFTVGEEPQAASHNQATLVLRREEARYLHLEELRTATEPGRRTSRDLKCLLHAAEAIASIHGLDVLAARILQLLGESIPADHGAILLGTAGIDDWQREFQWQRSEGGKPVRAPRGILRRVTQERVSIWSNDVLSDANVPRTESVTALRINSVLAVPLIILDRVMGAVYLHSGQLEIQFDRDHLELLTGFAAVIAGPLENALRIQQLESENRLLHAEMAVDHRMVGDGARMQQVFEFVRKVAESDSSILIGGESGTGKELVARAIHRNSRRGNKMFMAINCAALTESLLETEMFGYEKGAFTGAMTQKAGRIEEAAGGTLFLDEVGELAHALQAKLLRVLQEREFERVGGTRSVKADIRLIAASNRNLKEEVEKGNFRRDLYFRLNVVSIIMPPLRERREDIPRLAQHFVDKYSGQSSRRVSGCSPEALECLKTYDWPGNVRELENAIERAIVMGSTSMILPEDLPETITEAAGRETSSGPRFHQTLREMKRQLVQKALDESQHSYSEAARLLGLHPNNLHRLMKNLSIKAGRK